MEIKNIKEQGGGYFKAENLGEEAGRMTYSDAGPDKFIISHTEVRPKYAGQGVGTQMVMKCVEYARDNNLKIIPLCSFAKSVFVKDDSIRDVLYG